MLNRKCEIMAVGRTLTPDDWLLTPGDWLLTPDY